MGWEIRRGKRYYYRKERRPDGRVRSIYCGTGERGEAAAAEDEARRIAQQNVTEIRDIKKEALDTETDALAEKEAVIERAPEVKQAAPAPLQRPQRRYRMNKVDAPKGYRTNRADEPRVLRRSQ